MIRVLYVDDEPTLLEIGKLFLEESKEFTIGTSTSAKDVLNAGNLSAYNAIVSDYQMPEMNGIEFLKEVRSRFGDIPFILFTGKGREEVVIEALNNGADFYLQKGGDPRSQFAELMHKIRVAVQQRRGKDEQMESERKYRSIVDNIIDGLFIHDFQGRILDVNENTCRMMGYTHEELVSASLSLIESEEDRRLMPERIEQLIREGSIRFEGQHVHKDGSLKAIEVSAKIVTREGSGIVQGFVRDITDRKQAEAALTTSKEYAETLIEAANAMVVSLNATGNLLRFNPAAENITGYTYAELADRNWFETLVPKDRYPEVWEEFNRLMAGGLPKHFENPILTRSGEERYIIWKNSEIRQKGQIIGIISFGIDITERKLAELELKETKDLFEGMLNGISDIVGLQLPDHTIVRYNQAGYDALGMSQDEVKGKKCYELIGRSSPCEICATSQALISRQRETVEKYVPELHWFLEFNSNPILNEKGEVVLIIEQLHDITERKRAEEEVIESGKKFSSVFQYNPVSLTLVSAIDGVFVDVNDAFLRNTGYARDEVIGKTPVELGIFADMNDYVTMASLVREQRQILGMEVGCRTKTGDIRSCRFSSSIIMMGGNPHILSTVEDITERKQAEEALRESEKTSRDLSSLLRLMCDNEPDMIWAKDTEKRYIFANKAICSRLLNAADTGEPIGKTDLFFAERERNDHADDPSWHTFGEICRDTDQITMDAGTPKQFDEYGNIQGKFLYVDVHKAPLIDENGKMIGTVGSARDVTENKQAEKSLQIFKALVEHSSDAIGMSTPEGRHYYQNAAFDRLFGKIWDNPPSTVYVDQAIGKEIFTTIMGGGSWQGEVKLFKTDRTILDIFLRAYAILNAEGQIIGLAGLYTDISERKRAEETILASLAEKEVLLREIHHRVKNNLASIMALIGLRINQITDADQIAQMRDLETRIKSMALVHETLYRSHDLSRISAQAYVQDLTRYLMESYAAPVNFRLNIDMKEIQIPIETAIPCGLIITEIVTNSLKYAFPNGVSCLEQPCEPCEISLSLKEEGGLFVLHASDNGIGMPIDTNLEQQTSLGRRLISLLAKDQLRGSLDIEVIPKPITSSRLSMKWVVFRPMRCKGKFWDNLIDTSNGTAYTLRFLKDLNSEKENHAE